MTLLQLALCLTYLFLGSSDQKTKSSVYVHQDSGFYPFDVGESVTLHCFYEGDAVMFYWYKQTLGQKPRVLSAVYKHDTIGTFLEEFEHDTRLRLDIGNGKNHLTISDLQISDSATYYCVGCYTYDCEFVDGATVSVEGSGFNIQALVHQSGSDNIQSTDQLSCTVHTGTCGGGHSVYWFKDSEESHSGLIYTRGDRDDQCERKPDMQTDTCFYNLPMKNLSHGTYCAVASCGHLLFGKGKESDTVDKGDSLVLVYYLTGAVACTITLAVVLMYAAYRMSNSLQSTDSEARTSPESTPNAAGYHDSDNLHYAALRKHKINRSNRQQDNTQTECVYSSVRH